MRDRYNLQRLDDEVHSAEELEETARMYRLLRGSNHPVLDGEQVAELKRRFPE